MSEAACAWGRLKFPAKRMEDWLKSSFRSDDFTDWPDDLGLPDEAKSKSKPKPEQVSRVLKALSSQLTSPQGVKLKQNGRDCELLAFLDEDDFNEHSRRLAALFRSAYAFSGNGQLDLWWMDSPMGFRASVVPSATMIRRLKQSEWNRLTSKPDFYNAWDELAAASPHVNPDTMLMVHGSVRFGKGSDQNWLDERVGAEILATFNVPEASTWFRPLKARNLIAVLERNPLSQIFWNSTRGKPIVEVVGCAAVDSGPKVMSQLLALLEKVSRHGATGKVVCSALVGPRSYRIQLAHGACTVEHIANSSPDAKRALDKALGATANRRRRRK
jgi:hypothetical protein